MKSSLRSPNVGFTSLTESVDTASAILRDPMVTKTEVHSHLAATLMTLNESEKREGYPLKPAAKFPENLEL